LRNQTKTNTKTGTKEKQTQNLLRNEQRAKKFR